MQYLPLQLFPLNRPFQGQKNLVLYKDALYPSKSVDNVFTFLFVIFIKTFLDFHSLKTNAKIPVISTFLALHLNAKSLETHTSYLSKPP